MLNPLLKAFLKEAIDVIAVGKAAAGKQWAALFSAVVQAGEDVPPIVANWADLKPELEKLLADPAADADLLAYAVGLVGGEDAKAQAIIVAAADLVLSGASKVSALIKAIELPAAVPVPEPVVPAPVVPAAS